MIDIKYKNIYEKFLEDYERIHISPWHNISKDKLKEYYNQLTNKLKIDDDYSFTYFMNYLLKIICGQDDAHTYLHSESSYSIKYKIIENEVLIDLPKDMHGYKLLTINNINIKDVINEFEKVIIYGTPGKRKYELEKALSNRMLLFGLPVFHDNKINDLELIFENNNKTIKKIMINKTINYENNIEQDKNIFGEPGNFKINDQALIIEHSSVQPKFKEKIINNYNLMKNTDISDAKKIIVDLRGNIGGDSRLNEPLIEFLKMHKKLPLYVLTDYRVFSSGRIALRDLLELNAIAIGEEISTPINSFGNNTWISIDKYEFAIATKYFNPFKHYQISSKNEYNEKMNNERLQPIVFKPDFYVTQTKEDFLSGNDNILNFALNIDRNILIK